MQKKIALLTFSFFIYVLGAGQTNGKGFALPTTIPNAPTAAAFARYGEIPVSISTGVPNISIPFFTINSGKLSLPISVNYHASGIKVLDQASCVGLGWSLQAGPQIARSVQGVEDFDAKGFYNMIFPDPTDPFLAQKEKCLAGGITDSRHESAKLDGQPDMFFYGLSGKSGKFILKNRVLKGLEPGFATLPYEPIQISRNGNEFTIVDDNGESYIYGSNNSQETSIDFSASENISSGYFSPSIPTSWHIKKIISADKTDAITFQYITHHKSTLSKPQFTLTRTFDDGGGSAYNTTQNSGIRSTVDEALVSEINFRNGKITFEYTTNTEDIQLDRVRIFQKKNGVFVEIKQWQLFYSRFINAGPPPVAGDYAQLRLDSVQEKGLLYNAVQNIPPHVFEYYSYGNHQSPPFNTKAQDFWGYFNGKTDNANLLFVGIPANGSLPPISVADKRKADPNYLPVGTLKQIQYPTGGKTIFELEPNQKVRNYMREVITRSYFGGFVIRESFIDYTPSVQFTLPNNLLVQNAGSGPYNVKLDFSGTLMCSGTTNCNYNRPAVMLKDLTTGQNPAYLTINELLDSNPNPPTGQQNRVAYVLLTAGHTYQLTFEVPTPPVTGKQYRSSLLASVSGEYEPVITYEPASELVLTGGLRIKKITSLDAMGNSLMKEYKYTKSYFNSDLFDGDFDKLALNCYKAENWTRKAGLPLPNGCAISHLKALTWSENLALPIGSVASNSISYNEIEEYQVDANGNSLGKTVYTYNEINDVLNAAMPLYKVDKETERGLLLNQKIYKSAGSAYTLVKETINNYKDLNTLYPAETDVVKFYTVHAMTDNKSEFPEGGGYIRTEGDGLFGCGMYDRANEFRIDKYSYTSSKIVLDNVTTTDYTDNGDPVSSLVTYEYDNPRYIQPTAQKETNSKGEEVKTTTKYPVHFPASNCTNTALVTLQQQLSALKTNRNSYITDLYNSYSVYSVPQPPGCVTLNEDSVMAINGRYNASQNSFDLWTGPSSQLLVNYNATMASYQNCAVNYYNAASSEEKAILDLQKMNNIAVPLEVKQYNNSTLNGTTKNVYKTFATNLTLPYQVQYGMKSQPLITRLQYHQYNPFSEFVDMSKSDDMHIAYIWDYYNSMPVAEVANADANSVAYSSFEADGNGGWTVTGVTQNDATAPTGSKTGQVGNGILKSGLTPAVVYKVSYWSKNGMYTVAGNQSGNGFPTTGPTINGWTYYEHRITGQTGAQITGSGWIDELRLYPENARMTTYTYEVLVGMTTQCDAKNRITYYEYDGLGRLKLIRDQDRNILKKFSYQYQQQY
jgi:YD repeat-containing protein